MHSKPVKCPFCGVFYNATQWDICPYCANGKIVTYPVGAGQEPADFSTVYSGPQFFKEVNELLDDKIHDKEMEKKLFFLLYRIVYDKLNLREVEEKFVEIDVPTKNMLIGPDEEPISKYFFLRNDIQISRLTDAEMTMVRDCINDPTSEKENELKSFLEQNLYRLLLPETTARYLFWPDRSHAAPADYIVIAFHTLDYKEGESDEIRSARDDIVYKELNRIQDESVDKYGLKVAVLKYNEFPIGGAVF